jgi:4'-phosphopantetheinyl transferase
MLSTARLWGRELAVVAQQEASAPPGVRRQAASRTPPRLRRMYCDPQPGAHVSLWWAPLDVPAAAWQGLAACLSAEEWRRADRFHRQIDRRRFVAARGWLRGLLSSQLHCAPGEVRIVTSDRGKPRLANSDLCFSAARSAGTALYATRSTMEVGVDVEAIRATADVEGIAARFFSQAEQRALASLPRGQRPEASFQCWTCKEAYGKCIGAGLSFPLRTVDTWVSGDQPTTVSGWSVHNVDVAPGFAAAVASEGLDEWVPSAPRKLGLPTSDWLAPEPRRNRWT